MKVTLTLFVISLFVANADLRAESAKGKAKTKKSDKISEITPEKRQKMAALHQSMADCLKSDRPISECRTEMRSSCKEMMGNEDCPMMNEMHRHGMMHHHQEES